MVRAAEVDTSKVSNRKVCIIDTGYDKGHPDLQTANVSGYSGPESAGPWDEDRNGHGTHVAGTIAALGGNSEGVVGVVPTGQMNLYIVRVFGNNGRFTWKSTLIAAVEKCVDAGSNIVSMSLGGPIASVLEATAYKRMTEEDGVLLIAAAGNGGNSGFSYPASYESVMSVGAVDSTETIASFSQYNTQVDISAPGVDVRSTTPGGNYRSYSGTSMATPHVAGVAALVWSHFPNLKGEQIRVALEENAVDKGADGYDEYYGHGLVDAKSAYDSLASGKVPSVCTDSRADWYNRWGSNYNCAWHSIGGRCERWGGSRPSNQDGLTAKEACCACGGGNSQNEDGPPSTPPPASTPAPTLSPTPAPTAAGGLCQDNTEVFTVDGRNASCKWVDFWDTENRCKDSVISSNCPVTCKTGCTCFDSESFKVFLRNRDCEWVSSTSKCYLNKFRSLCPIACGICEG